MRLYVVDGHNPQGKLVYAGIITDIDRIFDKTQYIELRAIGLFSLFNFVTLSGTFTDTITGLLQEIIDQVNVLYPFFSTDIETIATTTTKNFSGKNAIEALKDLAQTDYAWTVDANGLFVFRKRENQNTHTFTLGKNIEKISVKDLYEDDGLLTVPKRSVSMTVYEYDIFSVYPGEIIKLRNI